MDNKIALVTGGASGLGLAIAEKFIRENIFTLIVGRDKLKLQEAHTRLGRLSDFRVCDLSNLALLPEFIDELTEKYEKIDILVNNAGIHLKKPMIEVSDEEFQRVILTNLTSVFSLSREVAKKMLAQKRGNILNISSMSAHYGIPQVIAYTAAKSAIEGMTRAMAVELSPLGIRVNCLAPGFIETAMSSKALKGDVERHRRILSRTPMGKLGDPTHVANAAFFIVSDAAEYITGAVLPVDGGNSIGF